MPGAAFVLETRGNNVSEFDQALLQDPRVPVIMWEQGKVDQLDGVFDILVFQTPFNKIHKINKSKIAMLQYGYAKEAHNYGAWRSFADLNLAYGEYAARKIGHFSPVAAVGNPRFDEWFNQEWKDAKREAFSSYKRDGRPTVVYAPTWGDLSSVERYLEAVCALSDEFNVLLKMHHNTDLLEGSRKEAISKENVHVFGANVDLFDLLTVADVFISDYSGAIFDALFCRVPTVLVDLDVEQVMGKKLDAFSIEFSRRADIGLQVSQPQELKQQVRAALSGGSGQLATEDIRRDLFVDTPGATDRAVQALNDLADGKYQRTQMQHYVRTELEQLYQVQLEIGALKRAVKKAKPKK